MTTQLLTTAALGDFTQQIINHYGCDGEITLYFKIRDAKGSEYNSFALCTIANRILTLHAYGEEVYSGGYIFKVPPTFSPKNIYDLNIITLEYAKAKGCDMDSVSTEIIARIWGTNREFYWP